MNRILPRKRALLPSFPALALMGLLAASCHLGQETQVENTLSFSRQFETLSAYDSLVIEVSDTAGGLLGVVFEAEPSDPSKLDDLEVPGWNGGPIVIVITGYLDGKDGPVYREEKRYDGRTRKTSILILLHPDPKLTSTVSGLTLTEGGLVPLPQVDLSPANLADPGLLWSTDHPGVAAVQGGSLAGIAAGATTLRARLMRDTTRQLAFAVQVDADSRAPTSLDLIQDTLKLARDGAPRWFGISVLPSGASSEVAWRLQDSTLVDLRSDGGFQGRKIGATRVWAVSRSTPRVGDSAWIAVGEPVPVGSVSFVKDSLVLFLGGAAESLAVEVLPIEANPEVDFSLSDPGKATLIGAILSPKEAGAFTVTARSREDTSKSDVLPVSVREPVQVTGVEADEKEVTLYLGGPSRILSAKVLPATAPQGVRWRSLSPANVSVDPLTGEISPLVPGTSQVVATSQADTTRRDTVVVSAKVDAPRLTVRADTVVSAGSTVEFRVTAEQEFGEIRLFQWDLDGDLAWDESLTGAWMGTSADLPPISRKYDRASTVTARFRAQDSEGNFSAVAAWTLRVVGGAAVSIDSPENNSFTNQRTIAVEWSVNGRRQDSLLTETLVPGPNVIRRTARDSAGKSHTDSVTVHLDTAAPLPPIVSGSSPTNQKPRWTWSTGGGGGMGEFRFRLGDANFPANAQTTRDTAHALAADPVSGTSYTLYVQERDQAGNWSPAASLAIRYDVSSPVVKFTAPRASGTHYTSVTPIALSGTATGPLAIASVSWRVGAGASTPAAFADSTWSVASLALQEGSLTQVTVTAEDQAGNKGEASLSLLLDMTQPSAPTLSTAPPEVVAAAKGTFGWTAGSDGASGSGLSGRYRYRLNGGAWKDTSAVLLVDLPLANGANTFDVQEQDRALLWSPSASRLVRVDTSGPVIALTGSNPRNSASTTVTLAGTVRDSTGGITMTVAGQLAGSGVVTVTGTSWTTAALTLASGPNTLTLTAADQLGNQRVLSVSVNVNVPAPVVVITNPADSLTVTNQNSIVVTYTVDGGAAQTRTFTLATDGVHRLVVASDPNVSGNIGRDTVKVTRDAAAPNAPVVTRGTSPTNGLAVWTWVSGGDNAGGAGMRSPPAYRYSLNGGTSWTQTSALRHELDAASGSHTLVVQEMDRGGNWSASSAAQTVVVDKIAPAVVITSPGNNYVTNQASVTVSYTVDGAAQTGPCNLTNANGSTTCTFGATDAAGNSGRDTITIWRRSTVIFFTRTGAGTKSGNDWQNARDSAGLVTAMGAAGLNRELWVATGTYPVTGTISVPNVTVLGGFNAAALPHSPANRNLTGTRFGYFQAGENTNITLDGVVLSVLSAFRARMTLINCRIAPLVEQSHAIYIPDAGSVITANNLIIQNTEFTFDVIWISGSTLTLNGGNISGNTSANIPVMVGGTINLNAPFSIGSNTATDPAQRPQQFHVMGGARLVVGPNVSVNCAPSANQVRLVSGGFCGAP